MNMSEKENNLESMVDSEVCITNPEEWKGLYVDSSRAYNDKDTSEILSLIDNVDVNNRNSLLNLDQAILRQKSNLMTMYNKYNKAHKEHPARILAQACWLIHHGIKHILKNEFGLISCEFNEDTLDTEYVFAP